MIKSIWIKNWKSFREAELPLAPLTLMIGANASGKSNAIEGIRCLSWLAEGRRLSEITSAVQEGDQLVRGTVESLTRDDEPEFTLGFRSDDGDWNEYRTRHHAGQHHPPGRARVGRDGGGAGGGQKADVGDSRLVRLEDLSNYPELVARGPWGS